jgi:metal-responsive CopG/Arc/MetJ family transcriptional regulator
MGRRQINEEQTPARFPGGTLDRIDRVLDPDTNEKRADFIRKAVDRELNRREKKER